MKLGMIHGWTEDSFRYVASKKLDAVEFCVNHNYDSDEFLAGAPKVKALSEKYGVPVGSMGRWGQALVDSDGKVIEKTMQDYKNVIDAAALLGCPVFNCGCNAFDEKKTMLENCEVAVKALRPVVEYGESKGVKIAVYNCSWANYICTPQRWEIVLPQLPTMGIKYDTSHCLGRGGDYLREMRDWGDRIYHFHLKGTLKIDGQHYDDPPVGLDQVNWGAVFDLLYTKHYDGMVSIEPHSGYWKDKMGQWGIDFSIAYLRPFIMPEDYVPSSDLSPYMP